MLCRGGPSPAGPAATALTPWIGALLAALIATACSDPRQSVIEDAVGGQSATPDTVVSPIGGTDAVPDIVLPSGDGDASRGGGGPVCTPGDGECADDDTQRLCNDSGAWQETPCGKDRKCYQGQCSEVICVPGYEPGECGEPDSYLVCNEVGTHLVTRQCPSGLLCYKGGCVDFECPPNAVACKGFGSVVRCLADGSAWEVTEQCEKGGSCFNGACVSACEVNLKAQTYRGCEYYAVDLDNIEGGQFEPVAIVVSVPAAVNDSEVRITDVSTGTIFSPADLGVTSLVVPAGALGVFHLPTGKDLDGSGKSRRSYHVELSSPGTVHQFNPLNGEGVYTNDASLLLPSTVGGRLYYVMSWPMRKDAAETLRGFATVVATEPGQTLVTVLPTAPVAAGAPGSGVNAIAAGQEVGFVLQQGEVLNLETDGEQGADLTGTRIEATQRVSAFGGHECANVPLGVNACDHLEQQLLPVAAWGTDYLADRFRARSPGQFDIWRIMAGSADVTVETIPPQSGYGKFILQPGTHVTFKSTENFQVRATGPVLVGHFMIGSSYPGHVKTCGNTGIGDPAFTLVVPLRQFLDEYTVLTPPGYVENYINVVAPTGADVTLDGAPVTGFELIVGSEPVHGVVQVPVTSGVHTIRAKKKVGLTAYGYDCDVSYAYPGGLKLQQIDAGTP